eukprot:421211-Prorocentrum_minimum.AAC.3
MRLYLLAHLLQLPGRWGNCGKVPSGRGTGRRAWRFATALHDCHVVDTPTGRRGPSEMFGGRGPSDFHRNL